MAARRAASSKISPKQRSTSRSSMPFVELVRRSITRTSSPLCASFRVTWEPRKPLAPITSFFLRSDTLLALVMSLVVGSSQLPTRQAYSRVAQPIRDAQGKQRIEDVLAKPGQLGRFDAPLPVGLLVRLVIMPVAVQIQSGGKPDHVVERPHTHRSGGGCERNLRCMNLVHCRLRGFPKGLPDKRDELISTHDDLPACLGGVADEVVGENPAPRLPVLGVQEAAITRLQLFDQFDLVRRRHRVRAERLILRHLSAPPGGDRLSASAQHIVLCSAENHSL